MQDAVTQTVDEWFVSLAWISKDDIDAAIYILSKLAAKVDNIFVWCKFHNIGRYHLAQTHAFKCQLMHHIFSLYVKEKI
jgi:hypothetical protein